jgi:hypothetical protein
MFFVLASALSILANVSDSTARTLASLHAGMVLRLVRVVCLQQRARNSQKQQSFFPICEAKDVQDVVMELGNQARLEVGLVESTVARHDCRGVDRSLLSLNELRCSHSPIITALCPHHPNPRPTSIPSPPSIDSDSNSSISFLSISALKPRKRPLNPLLPFQIARDRVPRTARSSEQPRFST